MLSATDLLEPVRLVELDRRKRGIEADAGCASGDRCGFGRPKQSRADSEPGGLTSDIDPCVMLIPVDPVR